MGSPKAVLFMLVWKVQGAKTPTKRIWLKNLNGKVGWLSEMKTDGGSDANILLQFSLSEEEEEEEEKERNVLGHLQGNDRPLSDFSVQRLFTTA